MHPLVFGDQPIQVLDLLGLGLDPPLEGVDFGLKFFDKGRGFA